MKRIIHTFLVILFLPFLNCNNTNSYKMGGQPIKYNYLEVTLSADEQPLSDEVSIKIWCGFYQHIYEIINVYGIDGTLPYTSHTFTIYTNKSNETNKQEILSFDISNVFHLKENQLIEVRNPYDGYSMIFLTYMEISLPSEYLIDNDMIYVSIDEQYLQNSYSKLSMSFIRTLSYKIDNDTISFNNSGIDNSSYLILNQKERIYNKLY